MQATFPLRLSEYKGSNVILPFVPLSKQPAAWVGWSSFDPEGSTHAQTDKICGGLAGGSRSNLLLLSGGIFHQEKLDS